MLVICVPADWVAYVLSRVKAIVRGSFLDEPDRTDLQVCAGKLLSVPETNASRIIVRGAIVHVYPVAPQESMYAGVRLVVRVGKRMPLAQTATPLVYVAV